MRARIAAALLIACAACGDDDSVVTPQPEQDAAFDASYGDADFGNFPPGQVPDGSTDETDPCITGSARGRGVMSGLLDRAVPELTPTSTLTRFPGGVPATFEGQPLPPPLGMELRDKGLLVSMNDGFFDVSLSGLSRFHFVDQEGNTPRVLPGELDGDGDEDAVSASLELIDRDDDASAPHGSLFFLLWDRADNGVLVQRAQIHTGLPASAPGFTLTDYDSDGDLDVLAYRYGALLAYRNDGAFVFTELRLGRTMESGYIEPDYLFAEDRNGDGSHDLVVFGRHSVQTKAWVYLSDGAGGFELPVTNDVFGTIPHAVHSGDVTGDGLSDLVMLEAFSHPPRLLLMAGRNATEYEAPIELGAEGSNLTLGDVDGDGALDIAVYGTKDLRVLYARGDAGFETEDFEVSASWLSDIAIEPPTGDRAARLHGLYTVPCRPACDDDCSLRCAFDACVACVAHNDCGEDRACTNGSCMAR